MNPRPRAVPPTGVEMPRTNLILCLLGAALVSGGAGCGKSKPANDGGGGTGGGGHGGQAGSKADGGADATDGPASDASDATGGPSQKVVILHTNDIHSHMMGQPPEKDYTPLDIADMDTTM